MRKDIKVAVLILTIALIATVPNVAADPVGAFVAKGTVQYENGTTCPSGWDLEMENLDQDLEGEPWTTTTYWVPPCYDYYKAGETVADSDRIRVNITSPDGSYKGTNTKVASEAFDGSFVIINITVYEQELPPETYTMDLVTGWNLVSLPLTPDDNSTSAVLGSITGNYDAVKSYNAATHQFEDATTMDPGTGYFIHMTAADTWSYDGTAYTDMTAQLVQGLNMVGWTNTSASLPGALDSIAGSYRYAAQWNATSQSYEVFVPGAPSEFNDFDMMDRGEGYFIAATTSCTLTYP